MAVRAAAMVVVMAVVLTAAVTEGAGKFAPAPAPVDCTSVVLSMADCLSFVTNGSTVDKPEGSCCSGLKQVLKTNPDCLCETFKSSAQFGLVFNLTKARALPSACHVHAPSITSCGLSVSPAGAPAGAIIAPAGAPSSSSIANTPSAGVGASETAPAAAPGAKSGSSSAFSVSVELMVAGVAAVFFSSF